MGRYKAHTSKRYIENYYEKVLNEQRKKKDKTSSKRPVRNSGKQPSEKDVQDAVKNV